MATRKLFLALCVLLQSACTAPAEPAASSPVVEAEATPSATASVMPTSMPSVTVPAEPTLILPPAIAPESFGQAQVLHEYWPAIRKAAGLWDEARFGMSETAWALSSDGRFLAVGGCDGEAGDGRLFAYTSISCEDTTLGTVAHAFLFILDAKTESIIATLPETGEKLTVQQVAFTHDSNKLVYGLDSGKVEIWDIAAGRIQAVISEEGPDSPGFVISPNDKWIALGLKDLTRIWDIAAEKLVVELPDSGYPALFSTDSQRLLAENYPYLVIYDISTRQKVSQQLVMPDGDTNTWDISPDLSLVAVCDTRFPDTPAKIWNAATGELIQTLAGEWGRCGRLIFSPDSRLLLRFDEHGAGPVIWKVDGWKLVQANANLTNFVGDKDFFVDRLQFSQDGRSMLVGTFKRLTLYTLPPGIASAPLATPAISSAMTSPMADPTAMPLQTIPPMSCDIVVQGWTNSHVQPCLPPSSVDAGMFDGLAVLIWMKDSEFTGVIFYIPLLLLRHKLQVGKYIIGDLTDGADGERIVAGFDYFDPLANSFSSYSSYDGGTIIFSQTGQYISGSFSFGARSIEGRQINADGSFENVPFTYVNLP